jgi:hypothetical protein
MRIGSWSLAFRRLGLFSGAELMVARLPAKGAELWVARLPICAQPAVGTNRQLASKKLKPPYGNFYFTPQNDRLSCL